MTTFYADIPTIVNGPAFGQPLANRLRANKLNGRIRHFEATYIAPAAGTAPAIGDKIYWGKLPLGARIIGHLSRLYWDTGTASCTMNLGDNVVAARHLAATAVTTTGSATPEVSALVNTGTGTTVIGSNQVTALVSLGSFQVGFKITGTGIPAGTTILGVDPVSKSLTLSAVATAAGTTVALTTAGGGYVATDDTNSVSNAYASTTDDATLVSTVAGAQVANNQAFVLKIAYVMD
jgi:hypothetical protein